MANTHYIRIGGQEVPFKATADFPRFYQYKFGRDIFKDIGILAKVFDPSTEQVEMDLPTMKILENFIYAMACQADPNITDSVDEWLDQFDFASLYQVGAELMQVWGIGMTAHVKRKKKSKK